METHLRTLFASISAVLLTTGTARAELHTFHVSQHVLNAEIVKAEGDTVLLKSDDGRMYKVEMNFFGSDDQLYIKRALGRQVAAGKPAQQGVTQQTAAQHPNLEVTWTKERSDSKQSAAVHNSTTTTALGGGGFQKQTSSAVQKSTSNSFLLHIKVVNKSPLETGDLEMRYQLCLSSTENSYTTDNKNKTTQSFKAGVSKCASLAPGASTTVDTESFTLETEDSQGYSALKRADGRSVSSDRHRKDEFKGVAVTFLRAGETVFEYVTPGLKKP